MLNMKKTLNIKSIGKSFALMAALMTSAGALQAAEAMSEADANATADTTNAAQAGIQKTIETIKIGGVGNVTFINPTHGYASSANGPFSALHFIVTFNEPQEDGSILAGMEHHFQTPTGGWLKTVDTVVMLPTNEENVFSIAVKYNIKEGGGGMEGFEGQFFQSRGFINMNTLVASVRYKGSITRMREVDFSKLSYSDEN